jgi:hypothetical protein
LYVYINIDKIEVLVKKKIHIWNVIMM